MIREVFRCPSCEQPVAIDCVSGEVVFDPDGLSALPCPHLSCFWICLSFVGGRKFAEKHTRSWLGTIGRGIRKIDAYLGLQQTEAINGLLLNSFIPIVIVALAWAFQGKTLRPVEAMGIAASFAGVLAIVARGDPRNLALLTLNVGDIWILLSVVAWAAYTLLLPRRPAAHPLAFLFAIALIGLVATLPLYLMELAAGRHIQPSAGAWAAIAYAGVFPAFLGFIFWNRGVEQVGASRAGLFIHLMPAFGILLAAAFLGERLAGYHLVGIALIFGGIYLTMRR